MRWATCLLLFALSASGVLGAELNLGTFNARDCVAEVGITYDDQTLALTEFWVEKKEGDICKLFVKFGNKERRVTITESIRVTVNRGPLGLITLERDEDGALYLPGVSVAVHK